MELTHLQKAIDLQVPSREEVLRRDSSVHQFWVENKELLVHAWEEWDKENKLDSTIGSIIDTELSRRVLIAWENPKTESSIKELIEEICPGVYQFQFIDLEKIKVLRSFLQKVDQSNIPLRAPYGIVLNRKGAMLDRRSEGYLAAPSFQNFYQEVIDIFMRPISRLLFPEITGYDTQSFGFSIQYKPTTDTSIRMHTDASSVTFNINLNLPEEEFTGSEVDFHDSGSGKVHRVKFKPGVAVIHKGNVPHTAYPITSGERTNLVLWLYGDQMQVQRGDSSVELQPEQRWKVPSNEPDDYAPF